MKKESLHKLFALFAAVGVLGVAPVAQAQEQEAAEPLDLESAMDEISGSLKSLRRLKRDPERWTKSAAAIREGADWVIKAMAFVPPEIKEMPEGPEKLKAMADARRLMGLTLAAFCELELAHLNEDEAKVEEITDKLKDLKEVSHEKYNKDE